MIRRNALLFLLPLLAGRAPLAAQSPVQRLPDLQVTATRLPIATWQVPASITILDGAELRERGVVFLADALAGVPSAMTVQTGSFGAAQSLFLRGGESDFTKILVDGVPLNAPGGSLSLANLTLDNVERIEVVGGPVSVLHGADAMSGVVQVFTRDGSGVPSGELAFHGGDLGTRRLAGRLAGGVGPIGVSLAGSRFSSDGIYDFNNRYLNGTGSARLAWRGGARGDAVLTVRYTDALGRFPTDGAGDPVDRNQRTLDEALALGMAASRPLSRRVTIRGAGWRHRLDSRFRDPQDAPSDSTGFGFAGRRDGVLVRRGLSLGLDWRGAGGVSLSVGAGAEQEHEDQQSVVASNFGSGPFEEAGSFTAARTTRFALAELLATLPGHLAVQAGVRLDDNSVFGTFQTWRAGLVWRPAAPVRSWVAVGTGFKAPTFSELLARTAFEVGNPMLDPERSIALEVGLEHRGRAGVVRLVAFSQRFRDLIQYVTAAPGTPTYANLGAARSRGVEASTRLELGRRASLRLHGTWLGTAVTDSGGSSSVTFAEGESLLRRPGFSGGISAAAPMGPLRLAGGATWVGARDDVDFRDFPSARTTLPSYVTVDLAVTVPLWSGLPGRPGFALDLRGENLLDAEFEQAVGFPGRGRTVLAGGRLTF